MSRLWLVVVVLTLVVLPVLPAAAAPDASVELTPGSSHSWQQSAERGFNLNYFGIVPGAPSGTCTKSVETYCDSVLVELSNPLTQAEVDAGAKSKRRLSSVRVQPVGGPTADYDLVVWESDAQGKRIRQIGMSKTGTPTVAWEAVTSASAPSRHVLVDVIYWVGMGSYTATVQF